MASDKDVYSVFFFTAVVVATSAAQIRYLRARLRPVQPANDTKVSFCHVTLLLFNSNLILPMKGKFCNESLVVQVIRADQNHHKVTRPTVEGEE